MLYGLLLTINYSDKFAISSFPRRAAAAFILYPEAPKWGVQTRLD
jgi:hypothetical protein